MTQSAPRSPVTVMMSTALLAVAACGDDGAAMQPDAPLAQPDHLTLPGSYYPESLSASADGTLYVGSIATGHVVAFDDGAAAPRTVLGDDTGITGVTGVLVHGDALLVCSIDVTFQRANAVKIFGLDGTARASYTLGAGRLCNDLAYDAAGNLYVTDSFSGTILRLAAGAATLEPWLSDPSLAPATAGAFGLDGVVAIGANVFATKLDTGAIYRIPINADGTAGAATALTITPALTAPDGLRALDDHTLLVAENTGAVAKVDLTTGAATDLATSLDQPTGVVVSRGAAWVTLGQLGRLFAQPPQAPNLPFSVVRVAL